MQAQTGHVSSEITSELPSSDLPCWDSHPTGWVAIVFLAGRPTIPGDGVVSGATGREPCHGAQNQDFYGIHDLLIIWSLGSLKELIKDIKGTLGS